MAFDVSNLSAYTDQTKTQLILKSQLSAKTASLINVMPGVKGATALNLLDTTTNFQSDGCGWNASGTTTLSNRVLTPGSVKVQEALCPKDLKTKYTVHQLKQGTKEEAEQIPFEEEYTNLKSAGIAGNLEKGIWQGDTGSGTANLNKFDGFIKIIDAAGTAVTANAFLATGTIAATSGDPTFTLTGGSLTTMGVVAGDKIRVSGTTYTIASVTDATHFEATANAAANYSGASYTVIPQTAQGFDSPITSITSSNAHTVAMHMYNGIPVEVLDKEGVAVFAGIDFFRLWQTNLTNLNLFHYTSETSNFELTIPGTTIKLYGVNGLNGTNRLFAGQLTNFYYGVDLLSDEEEFKIWYSQDNSEVRFEARFTAGVQVAYPSEIVQFRLA
jgi:hypothetical protein